MNSEAFDAGMRAMAIIILFVAIVVAIGVAIYYSGREAGAAAAAKEAAAKERQSRARTAVAGLQGRRGGPGALRGELDGLSRDHLRDVAHLVGKE